MFPVTLIHEKSRQAGLEYLVIGGHAVNTYCAQRLTFDVDFLVRRDDLPRWTGLLEHEGFTVDYVGPTFVRFNPPYGTEWRLDLMLVNAGTFQKMQAGSRLKNLLGIDTLVPSPEHLIALKLHALKHGHPERFEKDFIDVVNLARETGLDPKSAAFRQLFEQFGTMELYERVLQRLG